MLSFSPRLYEASNFHIDCLHGICLQVNPSLHNKIGSDLCDILQYGAPKVLSNNFWSSCVVQVKTPRVSVGSKHISRCLAYPWISDILWAVDKNETT